jgi:hypothetical protein
MDGYVPISERTAAALRARAAELRQLAETARTLATVEALLRLAERYEKATADREHCP